MDKDYDVLTRRICLVYNCRGGFIDMDAKYKTKCDHCIDGYIEEWIDLQTLIRQIINL